MSRAPVTVVTGTCRGALEECLAAAKSALGPSCIVIGSSPDTLWFGRFEQGEYVHPTEKADSSTWYEARAFSPTADFRWLQDGLGPSGRAATIAEETRPSLDSQWTLREATALLTVDQTSLLWGMGTGSSRGDWSTMAAARIGRYSVPLGGVGNSVSVLLRSREYYAPGPDGNAVLIDERLIDLVAQAEPRTANEPTEEP